MKKTIFCSLIIFLLITCKENKELNGLTANKFVVTKDKDTLEVGNWEVVNSKGLSKRGRYRNGFKEGVWLYRLNTNEKLVEWDLFKEKGLIFNYPKFLKVVNEQDKSILFLGDIVDNNDFTYIALMKYDLKELKSSVYDYLYQMNERFTSNSKREIVVKLFKKYTFSNTEIYKVNIKLVENDVNYEILTYVFKVDECLFELVYKDVISKIDDFDKEVFNDILYSIEYKNVDLFSYSSKKYEKEENIVFE